MTIRTAPVSEEEAALERFIARYGFALKEIGTRIDILKGEFEAIHRYSPIEHVRRRVKTPESILNKVHRRGLDPTLETIRREIRDIAGIRITCSFVSDIYRVASMLVQQPDLSVLEQQDYIDEPKASGYRSLHLIIDVPVYLSDRIDHVPVEVQLRTIAMDFWASLEHKIYYKYEGAVPRRLKDDLLDAAQDIDRLDQKMERMHREMRNVRITPFDPE